MASKQIKGTVEGYSLWAFEQFAEVTGRKEATALAWIVDNWTELDKSRLAEMGITLETYRQEQGALVVPISRKKS